MIETRKEEGQLVISRHNATVQPRPMIVVNPKTPFTKEIASAQAQYTGVELLTLEESDLTHLYGTILRPDTTVSVATHYLHNTTAKVLVLAKDGNYTLHTTATKQSQSHLCIHIKAGVQATLVQHIEDFCDGLHDFACEVLLEEGAKLIFTVVQNLPATVQLRYHRAARVMANAHFDVQDIVLGAEYEELTSNVYLEGSQAKGLQTATLLGDGNRLLLSQQSHHVVGDTESDITTKGVLQNAAHVGLQGLVAIRPKAANSSGYQQMDVLLLDAQSRASAIPELAIQTNEVSCSHGATIGELDAEELFYLMSRGLSKKQATHLMLIGFLSAGISKLPEAAQEGILQLIEARLQ